MDVAASAGAASARLPEPRRIPTPESSPDAFSSSSPSTSPAADLRPVAGEAGGEKGVLLDLDSPWAAPAEAERVLGEAAATDAAAAPAVARSRGLMALKAIYGHDLAVFGNIGGLRYFQICIRYDVADGIEVCAKLSSANVCAKGEGCSDGTGQSDGSDVFSYKCNFEYLPPLILTCLLTRSYPS
ncbi:hypothetical protein C2845_PM16G18530 [Panicum miliaceum]|uniref:Uncharacterized protein n=1 Tax=Panicum miliaceum TaxID=4540 RepID=A0A3L6PWW4_PANMI|nr:hypothetical protein C2845_PM16G18530 [Panicum miliaceum]